MPTIKISLLEGRSQQIKQQLATEITQTMMRILNSKPEDIHIIFEDIKESNWMIGNELEDIRSSNN